MKRIFLSLFLILTATSVFALPDLIEKQLFKANTIDSIYLDLAWENIDIQESNETQNISVEIYCNKTKFAPSIQASGSTITVKSVNSNNYVFIGEQRKGTVIVRIPSTARFEKFLMDTTSGNISADSIYGERLKASSTSGKIKLSNLDVQQLKATATSGSITVEGSISQAFDCGTTSGMINFELDDAPSSNSRATATSGSIFVGVPGDSAFSLRVQTTSGAFINTLTNEKIRDHVSYNRDVNKGGATIILSTTSGRITVDSTNGVIANAIDSSIEPDIPVVSFDDPIF